MIVNIGRYKIHFRRELAITLARLPVISKDSFMDNTFLHNTFRLRTFVRMSLAENKIPQINASI